MGALLFGVRPDDPLTFLTTAGVCVLVAILSALRPALRAARVDPITALRSE
jgi:putative ABC transport system permease protein